VKQLIIFIFILALLPETAFSNKSGDISKILIEIPEGKTEETALIAIQRIRAYTGAVVNVSHTTVEESGRSKYDLTIILGAQDHSPELQSQWQKHSSAKEDSYLIHTITEEPLTIIVSGNNERGMLYAAYQLADLLKTKDDISALDLFFEPKIGERYLSFGATTHGRRYYRPALYYESLKELPRYGYNGVIIYPGGGTPIGRRNSPVLEGENGELYLNEENTKAWRKWFGEIKAYHHDIMMAIPPLLPPGYSKNEINEFYAGGDEPDEFISNLRVHFRKFLELLIQDYPEIDRYLFNSTEGATFGNNKRFFGHINPEQYSVDAYNINNEKIMRAYFEVLKDFFKQDIDKVGFWTHSYGLTSKGIRIMREVLFENPEVMIVEDDFWNNNLWPFDIPSMYYLPEDLRAEVSTKNPFALFQIAPDGEYYGGGSLPNAYPNSHIRSANEAIERNADMLIQRIDLHDRTPYGTLFGTLEIIPLAASKQIWSPTPEESQIWQEWANRRFGKQAAPYVINALQESENIILNGLSCNGIDLLAVHSEFIPRLWVKDKSGLSRFYLFSKPNLQLVNKTGDSVIFSHEYTAYQMNTHTIPIETFRSNQSKAMESVNYGLIQIEKAKLHLEKKDYEMLQEIFVNGKNVLNAIQLLGEAAYATNIMLSNFDNVKEPVKLFESSIQNLEDFIRESDLIPEMKANLQKIADNYKQVGHTSMNRNN
jgi:hypothetical protein